ncbi:acetyltransferase (GNAT) family protein [Prauserella shujinwangii]|uniref:Acetyltransferase (GNAT) family protein n=1 Tax=Prauserella shujinwangii TaxID=1453103 RepID=A0A2T0LW82_9PSEU|nr:GNAT family N-acetyltransferase [Prauserella shujinwangii]PRX48274.1 acetyltransferase (GNAT) family protein [Prauserella shujinwangii]
MSDVRIRAARPGELAEVGELTVAAYRADGLLTHDAGDSYAGELRDARARAEQAELLVAVDGTGTLLGTVTVTRAGTPYAELARDDELEFRMLAVAGHARGRGVGEALVTAVLDRARELAAPRVVLCSLDAMRTAHRLYERLGFRRAPERDWYPVPGLALRAFVHDRLR